MKKINEVIDRILPEIIELRQKIHSEPELEYDCFLTAEKVVGKLHKIRNLDIKTGIAKSGVVATLNKDKPGPCIALRADMDALPIQEQNQVEYASKFAGKMHACGHDGHTACLVGAALALGEIQDHLPGPVKFIFQPAEEDGPGALEMIKEGVLENPKVEQIFGLHGWPELPLGQVGTKTGALLAGVDSFDIKIRGVGTHAAWPHTGIDPILVASHVVLALQAIAARFTDPFDSVVVAVSVFNAGTTHNIMPETASLAGTVRTLSIKTRNKVLDLMRNICQQTAAAYGAVAEINFHISSLPPTINDQEATKLLTSAAKSFLAPSLVKEEVPAVMGGEDFSFYLERIPGSFWVLGLQVQDQDPNYMLHTPIFNFRDEALKLGMQMHCAVVMRFFNL